MNTALIIFGLNLAPLYSAIAQVESDRGATSSNVYQLRKIYVADVQRITLERRLPSVGLYADIVNDPRKSEQAMSIYWTYYGGIWIKEHPYRRISYEWLARVHNGGPDGWRKASTISYWNRVKKELQKLGVSEK